jgi:hypothetical protein
MPAQSMSKPQVATQNAQVARYRAAQATYDETVGSRAAVVLYVLTLVAVVVGVDVLFFRHHFWERLIANVGIVLLFAAFYLRFRRPLGG